MSRRKPTSDLDVLRNLGYAVGWSPSKMDVPFRMGPGVIVLDATRPEGERWAAVEWAAGIALGERPAEVGF